MPEFTKTLEATKAKVQPWRKVWPAPNASESRNLKNPSGGGGIMEHLHTMIRMRVLLPKKKQSNLH